MPETPLKIIQFRAENTKRLRAVTISPDPEQPIVVLTGKNRQGKTSIIDAIWFALGGRSSIPSKPIRVGEKEAVAMLDLGEFIVERRITEKGSYLNVTTKEGFKASSAQTFLSTRLGDRAQNPLEFMRLSPAEQVTALQSMVNLSLPVEEFQQITNLEIPAGGFKNMDPVMVLDNAYKYLYDKRGEVNKEVKRLEGTIKSLASEIPPGKEETRPISVQELFAERKTLEAKQAANDKQREALAKDTSKLETLERNIGTIDAKIAELENELVKLRDNRQVIVMQHQELDGELAGCRLAIEQLEDPDFTDIDARIAAADETNRIANLVKSYSDTSAELDQVSAKSTDLTSRLAALKDLKGRLIAEAGLPVPGLGFANGEVTYHDLPLSQASGREQIEISCAVCMAQHPAIGILTIDVGWSELDSDGKEVIRKWAQEVGAQIWVTKVTDSMEDGGFYIEDGELVAIDGEPVMEASGGNGDEKKAGRKTKSKAPAVITGTDYVPQSAEPDKPDWMF